MNYYRKVSDKEMEKLVDKFIATAHNIRKKKQMKEFDYWWEENATEYDVENYYKDCMRRSWKGALEWLYVDMTSYDSTQVRDMINKELSNE